MSRKTSFVISSIRPFRHWRKYVENMNDIDHNNLKIFFVDLRGHKRSCHEENKNVFSDFDVEFVFDTLFLYEQFGRVMGKRYEKVIPRKCSAEKSIGLLKAWIDGSDIIITIDDDTYPTSDFDFLATNYNVINSKSNQVVASSNKWFNPMECLQLNMDIELYSRGFPYEKMGNAKYSTLHDKEARIVFNQGLWTNVPDLDAVTLLHLGALNGISTVKSISLNKERVILAPGTYVTVCAMNLAFSSEIVPAFYQLQMGKEYGIERFDDIWSGIFLKKVIDHMGDRMALGAPTVFHDKVPRPIFRDLQVEANGMIINEYLWKLVDSIEVLDNSDYLACYYSLASALEARINDIPSDHRSYLKHLFRSMKLWCEICENLQ